MKSLLREEEAAAAKHVATERWKRVSQSREVLVAAPEENLDNEQVDSTFTKLLLDVELEETIPSDCVLPLRTGPARIEQRIRLLNLTYFLQADALGPAGSLQLNEPANAYQQRQARCFLRRMRVPLHSSPFALDYNGVQAGYVSSSRTARPIGAHAHVPLARQPGREAANRKISKAQMTEKLHWPAVPTEQFISPEQLAVGSELRLLGHKIRILRCADEMSREWMERRGLAGSDGRTPVTARPDPYTEEEARTKAEQARAVAAAAEARSRGGGELRLRPSGRRAYNNFRTAAAFGRP